jgi:hypothetical protein
MKFQRCTNPTCARPFQVNEFRVKAHEPGQIICPHCAHEVPAFSNSVFLVHAMLPEQEAQFEAENPRRPDDDAA